VFDCWWERFDVVGYMKISLSTEQFQHLTQSRSKPKIGSILELIEQAKRRTDTK
jgi:hypothetical protein